MDGCFCLFACVSIVWLFPTFHWFQSKYKHRIMRPQIVSAQLPAPMDPNTTQPGEFHLRQLTLTIPSEEQG